MLSIIVPTWDQSHLTRACFESVRKNTKLPYELIWVENGSTKVHHRAVGPAFRQHRNRRLVKFPHNKGFVKGSNAGIRASRGDTIVMLNNDTQVMPGWDTEMQYALDHNKSIGIVGPLTSNGHQAQTWQLMPQTLHMPIHARVRSAPNEAERARVLKSLYSKRHRVVPHMVAFFAAAIKRAVINKIGLLDEGYGMGFADDDDYCARTRKAGWKIAVCLGAYVLHHHRATFKAKVPNWQKQLHGNVAKLKKRWGGYTGHK